MNSVGVKSLPLGNDSTTRPKVVKGALLIAIHLQRRDERFLRDVDFAELAHAFFAGFLFVQQFAFAAGVAAVAFGGHVFAERTDGFASDDAAADGGLHWDFEHVLRDQLFELFHHGAAA